MAKMRKVTVVRGYGAFVDPYHLEVEETTGSGQDKTGKKQTIRFKQCIIAAGSQAMRLPFLPDDPRIVDSTGALELRQSPKKMLIVGGGIIGLEMGTVYSTLGARLDVVEMLDGLMLGADRDLVRVWQKMNAPRFDNIMLKTKTVGAEGQRRRHPRELRRRGRAEGAAALRPRAAGGGPQPQRQEDRRRQGRRRRQRPRLHPGGRADAHQRAAHLRHRRHRRPADARAQGGARGACGGRGGCGRRQGALRRARDSQRGLHRPRGGLGGPDRGRGQGARHRGQEGPVPVDGVGPRHRQRPRRRLHQAAVRRTRPTASSAAASSARTRAT